MYGNVVIDETPPERFQRCQNVVNLGFNSNNMVLIQHSIIYIIIYNTNYLDLVWSTFLGSKKAIEANSV